MKTGKFLLGIITVFSAFAINVRAETTEIYGSNLLEGGTFEESAVGAATSTVWNPYYNWSVAFAEVVSNENNASDVYSGSRAIRFCNAGSSNNRGIWYTQIANISQSTLKGETYCLSGYFKTNNPNGAKLSAQLMAGKYASTEDGDTTVTLTNQWQKVKFYTTLTADASLAMVRINSMDAAPSCLASVSTYQAAAAALGKESTDYCIYADNIELRRVYTINVEEENIGTELVGINGDTGWRIDENSVLWIWNTDEPGYQEKILEDVAMADAGVAHMAVLTRNGDVYARGDNEWGQLGDGTFVDKTEFVKVAEDVKKVACGDDFTLILKNNGDIYSTGHRSGAFNAGSGANVQSSFTIVTTDAKNVFAGPKSIYVLSNSYTLYAAGDNGYGQLGCGGWLPQYTLTQVMDNVKKVSAEREYTLILTNDGKMYGCGWNLYGQLGETVDDTDKPVLLRENVSDISASPFASLALGTDNKLYSVGGGDAGFINGKGSMTSAVSDNIMMLCDNGAVLSNSGDVYVFDNGLKPADTIKSYVADYVYDGTNISGRVYHDGQPATLIVAQYLGGGRFNGISMIPYKDEMNNVIDFNVKLNSDTKTVKVMMFKDLNLIEPVMKCYTKDLTVN